MTFRRHPLLVSGLAYTAITVVMGRAVLAELASAIAADRVDPLLNAAILVWNARHFPWTEAWYNFPIFYPLEGALTFSEHLLGLSVVSSPIYWITRDPLITYNLTYLATYILCGMAMFALVWRLTGNTTASFLAGLAYMLAPYRASHQGHIQMLALFWAPLALLGLHAFLTTGRRAWVIVFAVCWMLQGAANGYLLVFFSVFVAFWMVWFVIAQRRWRDLAIIAAAGIVAVLPLAPILFRYVETHSRYGLTRPIEEVVFYSADIASVLCPTPRLSNWGGGPLAQVCGGERDLYPGLTLLGVCLASLWYATRRGEQRPIAVKVAAAISGLLLVVGVAMIGGAVAVALVGPWNWQLGPMSASASSVIQHFSRGMLVLVAAAVFSPALWQAIRRASVPGFYLVMALVTWTLTWGPMPVLNGKPALEQGPYGWLMLLPGVDALRVPPRFWAMTVLSLSVALGILLAGALRSRGVAVRRTIAAVGTVVLVLDGWTGMNAVRPVPSAPRPDLLVGGTALTLPLGAHLDRDAAAEYDAVIGGWKSVNGYSGHEPGHYMQLRDASKRADPLLLAPFLAREDLNVIVYESWPQQDALIEQQPGVMLVGRGNGLRQYRIPRQGD